MCGCRWGCIMICSNCVTITLIRNTYRLFELDWETKKYECWSVLQTSNETSSSVSASISSMNSASDVFEACNDWLSSCLDYSDSFIWSLTSAEEVLMSGCLLWVTSFSLQPWQKLRSSSVFSLYRYLSFRRFLYVRSFLFINVLP